ncbi:glutathione peroxidase [Actinoplanes sp. NPDC020271]|uniref:glutathione peroxidase n=1 Tax=Actinoplanes sp. NPDC020271 TaxID=3363896 RepID=UPI0037A3AF11
MTVHDFTVSTADGAKQPLSDYAGRVLLIVNVASRCGMTPQYAGLEALHREFGERGLQVLGFPCNQFGGQEPGTDEEIQEFCSVNYGVTFPVFAKVDVNGPEAAPLYEFLRAQDGGDVRWNFTKFLVGRDGAVLRRYEPNVTPEEIGKDLTEVLG